MTSTESTKATASKSATTKIRSGQTDTAPTKLDALGAGSSPTGSSVTGSSTAGSGTAESSGTGSVPAFPIGSSRPAWQPMPVKPAGDGPNGVTIFGTTLTRRQTAIGAAVLALILLVLILVVPRAFGGSDDDDKSQGSAPGVVPAASSTGGPASAAASAPPSTTATTQPASAAPTTAASKPSPKTSGVAVALPAGWRLYTDSKWGFKVPVPKNWSGPDHEGTETYFRENSGQHRLMIIDQTRTPASNPVADWEGKEAARRGTYADYDRVKIVAVKYWDKAADWEYKYDSASGNRLHTVKRGFVTAKDQAYGITWSTPDSKWKSDLPDLALIYKGFIPARS